MSVSRDESRNPLANGLLSIFSLVIWGADGERQQTFPHISDVTTLQTLEILAVINLRASVIDRSAWQTTSHSVRTTENLSALTAVESESSSLIRDLWLNIDNLSDQYINYLLIAVSVLGSLTLIAVNLVKDHFTFTWWCNCCRQRPQQSDNLCLDKKSQYLESVFQSGVTFWIFGITETSHFRIWNIKS